MRSLSWIISRLFQFRNRLSLIDTMVLERVKAEQDEMIKAIWDKQIAAINKVYHAPDNAEARFYRLKNGKPSFDSAIAFPNKEEEICVANLSISIGSEIGVDARVWAGRGFISSIEYRGAVDYYEEAAGGDPPLKINIHCELVGKLSTLEG